MKKLFCTACGNELKKADIAEYDYKTGKPIYRLKCPNYDKRSFFDKIMDIENPHIYCYENAVFSSFSTLNKEENE